jgi:RNA polymerase sigma-70 factor, ECF subfamily
MQAEGVEPVAALAPSVAARPAVGFEAFYADHAATILAVVLALRGPRVAAEELVQEAFVRAYHRWDEVGVMARPDLWVQRVALNLASSQLRRLAAEGRALVRFAGRGADVAETFDFEAAEGFWRLVRRLPPRQAHVVALHYAADRSVAEIAEVLEVAEGTVKAHLHKARTRLTKLLAEEVER